MSNKPLTLVTPPAFQCYDCKGCGDCCRGYFDIIITREDRDRIVAQGWDREPDLQGVPLFTPRGHDFVLAHREDGACVFLNEQGLCRIHARFGEPAKPTACRLYPFRFVPLGPQVRIDLRYDCPAVAANQGKAVTAYRADLLGLMRQVVPERAAALSAPPLFLGVPATWAQLSRITEAFERLLREDSFDLTRRMLCCANLVALLRSRRVAELEGRKLSEFLEEVAKKLIQAVAEDDLVRHAPSRMEQTLFRQLLATYGRTDRRGQQEKPLRRFAASLRMIAGRGPVPLLSPDFPTVDFAAVDTLAGFPTPTVTETLLRYYRMRLAGMGFFGRSFYGRNYLDGMNALLLTYPVLLWYTMFFAMGKGLELPDAASAERALRVVDHQHGITPILDLPSERFRQRYLCERSTLRSLMLWYGS